MFKNPFSFHGRIRRTEYGLSVLLGILGYFLCYLFSSITAVILQTDVGKFNALFWFLLIPVLYFISAQNVKRCHDMGRSGWYHLNPLYCFRLMFREGDSGANKYGLNPKDLANFEAFTGFEKSH